MQRLDGRFVYSASDLNDYLECKRLSELQALVARKKLAPPEAHDERAELIRRKGDEHERRHLEALKERFPGEVLQFDRAESGVEQYRAAEERTLEAMRSGARVIYQATFFDGTFIGHADFLLRVDRPSRFGEYGYEVVDTKLGLSPKAYYLVQICNYSEHLERLQGCMPEFGHVVFGDGSDRRFRLADYMAYYRHLKASFVRFAGDASLERLDDARSYPLKCNHCEICDWNEACKERRDGDDHLSLVARMRRDQVPKFEAAGIARVADLAAAGDDRRPLGMNEDTFVKLRRQAALQVRGRTSPVPLHELLPHEAPLGFFLLPAPSAGDVFFDMEGDPLYEPGRGLEYLFGCWMPGDKPEFLPFWGTSRAQEKRAFEDFVDFIMERRRRLPELHVYHYAPYEKTVLRRLAQAHATREHEIDELLRHEVLVDLYAVVRQTLTISEESYSLKKLEKFYDLARATEVKKGDDSIVMFERWLLDGDQRILDDIEAYNQDDCRSTYLLREWLLARRAEAATQFGVEFPFRVKDPKKEREEAESDRIERGELERALIGDMLLPQNEDEYARLSPARRVRYLLACLVGYHKREERPQWWSFFDRCENVDRLLEFDRDAIGGLSLNEDFAPRDIVKSKIYTFAFPSQHHKMKPGTAIDPRTQKSYTIVAIDDDRGLLELRTTATLEQVREISELIPPKPMSCDQQRLAIVRIARAFLAGSLESTHPATAEMLANRRPRLSREGPVQPERVDAASISSTAMQLNSSHLFVQGPPGSGKSTYASEVIADLLAAGKRVAVTSTTHAAIHNLLHKVEGCVAERGRRFCGRYKHSRNNEGSEYRSKLDDPMIVSEDKNGWLDGDDYQLAGGTAFVLAREELANKFDYLFVDEAGQVALADALALSLCAHNVVLLGDPSQLAQVSQGYQPLHAGDSVLVHLLGDAQTVAPDRGIFLDVSYRMQSEICGFVSEMMYDGRLRPSEAARGHRVDAAGRELAGLYYLPVEHAANGASSLEEADEIVRRIVDLYPYERDIIVVTPYNAQRRAIAQRLADAGIPVRVGTVDKFQGQQAAVVFYSMATSSGDELPRSLAFLFERNRFNVAISRAKAVSALVCSPRLLDISCRTPDEMALVNLVCAFVERAHRGLGTALNGEGDAGSGAGAAELESYGGRA